MKAMEERKLFKYKGAGLDNIYLSNGYKIRKTRYGKAVAVEDVEGLHKAIGLYLVDNRAYLSGAEFRFLRKELDLSQKQLGRLIGVGEQAIAKWEKTGKPQVYGDRFIRALYKDHIDGGVALFQMVKRLNKTDRQKAGKYVFQETEDGWDIAA